MRQRLGLLLVGLVVAACNATATPEPAESTPPLPAASPGWQSIGSFSGTGGSGWLSAEFALAGRPTVLAATCIGNGTLVIAASPGQSGPVTGPARAFVLPCGATNPAVGRVAIDEMMPVPDVATLSAGVVDDPGTLRYPAFQLSVEQPAR